MRSGEDYPASAPTLQCVQLGARRHRAEERSTACSKSGGWELTACPVSEVSLHLFKQARPRRAQEFRAHFSFTRGHVHICRRVEVGLISRDEDLHAIFCAGGPGWELEGDAAPEIDSEVDVFRFEDAPLILGEQCGLSRLDRLACSIKEINVHQLNGIHRFSVVAQGVNSDTALDKPRYPFPLDLF